MKCPVCGNDTFDEDDFEYDICSECFWEYDPVQAEDPDYSGGANSHSLNGYRQIYNRLKKQYPDFSCTNDAYRDWIVTLDHESDGYFPFDFLTLP